MNAREFVRVGVGVCERETKREVKRELKRRSVLGRLSARE